MYEYENLVQTLCGEHAISVPTVVECGEIPHIIAIRKPEISFWGWNIYCTKPLEWITFHHRVHFILANFTCFLLWPISLQHKKSKKLLKSDKRNLTICARKRYWLLILIPAKNPFVCLAEAIILKNERWNGKDKRDLMQALKDVQAVPFVPFYLQRMYQPFMYIDHFLIFYQFCMENEKLIRIHLCSMLNG